MSFLSWFGKKQASRESLPEQSSDLGQVDVTLPITRLQHAQQPADKSSDGSSRKNERMERRELLYGVVRECMTATGVLSSTYKFKVLSLDSSGRKYLIMVDMPHEYLSDVARFTQTEGTIARSAKDRYDILVTAVYWRVNELVSAAGQGLHVPAAESAHVPQAHNNRSANVPVRAAAPYAELQAEEVMAFKRAVAAAASGAAPRSETRQSVRAHTAQIEQVPDFSDTEPFEAATPLGPTQFGGLN